MRKGKDIIGKPIVTYDAGKKVSTIKDLIFSQNDNTLLGFLISEGSWLRQAKVLPLYLVKAIGMDAIIVPSREAIASASEYPDLDAIIHNNNVLNGTRIMTTDGRDLGKLVDFYFDEKTGTVEGYETSGGLFADAYSGRSFVPAPQTIVIGRDVAFVPVETVTLMEEQVGGIKAAMLTAGEKIQSTAQVAGERLQEAGEQIRSTAQVAGAKLQETAQTTGEKIQTAGRLASTKVTDAIVDRAAQKNFVLGKVAQQTVDLPNGTELVAVGTRITPQIVATAETEEMLDRLYRAAGGSLTAPLGARVGDAMAGWGIDSPLERLRQRAQGRRAQRVVYAPGGYIIAAQGQIVTARTIERAQATHQESALLEAVGLSAPAALQSQAGALAVNTSDRLKTTTAAASERIQASTANIWERVKETTNELQGKSAQALEQQRIKRALGRPATRVILDRHDGVILNVGELISHKAIAAARNADVLDLLLDSVYTETPHLSIDELRAPAKGTAAL